MANNKLSSLEGRKLKNELKESGEKLSSALEELFNGDEDSLSYDLYQYYEVAEQLRLGTLTLEAAREARKSIDETPPIPDGETLGRSVASIINTVFSHQNAPDPQVAHLGIERQRIELGMSKEEMRDYLTNSGEVMKELLTSDDYVSAMGENVQAMLAIDQQADRLVMQAMNEAIPKLERLQEIETSQER